MTTRRIKLESLSDQAPTPPLLPAPLPEPALTLVRYSAAWVMAEFPAFEHGNMMPAVASANILQPS